MQRPPASRLPERGPSDVPTRPATALQAGRSSARFRVAFSGRSRYIARIKPMGGDMGTAGPGDGKALGAAAGGEPRLARLGALLCAALLAAVAVGMADAAEPVTSCAGQSDGTPCVDNGDGCTDETGFDACASGTCTSPGPCLNTVFRAAGPKSVETSWQKPFSAVTRGESCESQGSITAAEVGAITGVVVGNPDEQVPLTRLKRKRVPTRGRGSDAHVVLRLKLNGLGRRLLKVTEGEGRPLNVVVVMRLKKPDASSVSARRLVGLLRAAR
jgi:hypothetical protein